MSGIAEILLTLGFPVSGSDLRPSAVTDRLEGMGARIGIGHRAENAAGADVVVTSTAVAKDNPEVTEARRAKVPVIHRSDMLAELMRLKYGVAVAGMHGKTTTTSMIAAVLHGGGLDPTVVVGGRVDAMGSNARLGQSRYLVAEADESDRSFLKLSPILAVVTNLDREHMDTYADMADVEGAFVSFMEKVPFYGAVVACADNPMLRPVLSRVARKVYTYGESADAEFRIVPTPRDPHREPECHSQWTVLHGGETLGPFQLHVPGRHNVLNATAAIVAALQLGLEPEAIASGLASYRGVDRRFQVKGTAAGATVVDDYGHHPTEIKATLQAARECGYGRVLVLFQPHRYTRTRDLMAEFAGAFGAADRVVILPIYAASEEPLEGISGEVLAQRVAEARGIVGADTVEFAASLPDGVAALVAQAREGDLLLTLGAGSVSAAGPLLLEALRARA